MFSRYFAVIFLSLFWMAPNAQNYNSYNTVPYQSQQQPYQQQYNHQWPYEPNDDNKGVCTINGRVYYGIDCWCYSSHIGSTFLTVTVVTLLVFFFISGCIWACLFACCKCVTGGKDDGDFGMGNIRSSIRSTTRRRREESQI